MRLVAPWAPTLEVRYQVESSLRLLIGRQIDSVRYLNPEFSELAEPASYDGFDSVSMGVEMLCRDGTGFGLIWLMEGALEGLALVVDVAPGDFKSPRFRDMDASAAMKDLVFAGSLIVGVAASWHHPDSPDMEALWSARLTFENGASVTIALGEIGDDGTGLQYQPDNLVVIFKDEISLGYTIPAGVEPAWGHKA